MPKSLMKIKSIFSEFCSPLMHIHSTLYYFILLFIYSNIVYKFRGSYNEFVCELLWLLEININKVILSIEENRKNYSHTMIIEHLPFGFVVEEGE